MSGLPGGTTHPHTDILEDDEATQEVYARQPSWEVVTDNAGEPVLLELAEEYRTPPPVVRLDPGPEGSLEDMRFATEDITLKSRDEVRSFSAAELRASTSRSVLPATSGLPHPLVFALVAGGFIAYVLVALFS